ncbi:hypothetical protein FNT36_17595 [Hymenobacter setariae]|uniref:Bacterial surface antigen (D15) domain-containing protein n=1 Tax=Hymenobacter setariae TaxID=2594794 RepID=A0A558BSI7_9BACT|nr:hypothetical protein [Hymenobacter setariae]TVT39462.1 hypothetical protein FNT36_17595 [Hymenobacter setariae]
MQKNGWLLALLLLLSGAARAQAPLLRSLSLTLDTTQYRLGEQMIPVAGEERLYFYYHQDDQAAELRLTPTQPGRPPRLLPSADYVLQDTLVAAANGEYRGTLRFHNLTGMPFVRLTFVQAGAPVKAPADSVGRAALRATMRQQVVSLLPLTNTTLTARVLDNELFVGEERVIEVNTNNIANVRVNNEWTKGQDIDYRLAREQGGLRLHVVPNALGVRTLTLKTLAERPYLDPTGHLSYQLPPLRLDFAVKASRLRFLTAERKDVNYDDEGRTRGIEFVLDNGHAFELQRTYRLEAQQEPGGALIAELYTRSYLSNDRVLCQLRVYNTHRQSDGYLYIKDNDLAKFITNFDITPRPRIANLSVLHRGGDWSSNTTINPGETVDVRLEGESLLKGRYHFDGGTVIPSDSSTRSEKALIYRVQVPLSSVRRRITIFDGSNATDFGLNVKEAQRPHPLNFVQVNYGDGPHPITQLNGPVLYDKTIPDLVFSFNANAIDEAGNLYGRQYLSMDIRTVDDKGNLIDQRTVDQLVICPGEASPRYAYYQGADCQVGNFSLNSILGRKTYDLDAWYRIIITVRNDARQYSTKGYSQQVELVLRRHVNFDISVSFPAGLLTKYQGESTYNSFGGISLATLAQLSFYSPDRINRLRPYRIGAGFVALNAFNLSNNADVQRDLGLVVLGSVVPVRTGARLTFPLYLGGGYLLTKGKPFLLFGPGIGVTL